MSIFNVFSLFGGLAMFLYGMHLMSDTIKESSSGTLKAIMERITNNTIKAFFLGVFVTALIQSSKATIIITAGLVAAGALTLRQSLGIIVGANVGTTITGQIIRLMDLNGASGGFIEWLEPANFAPIALVIGIIMIMFVKTENSKTIGNIAMGFGILFIGLMNMTTAVNTLATSGSFENLIALLNKNSILGYLFGAILAFILQSSSASVGVIQAFSASGILTFSGVFVIILGIYLGECLTTYMVAAEGGKADSRRVGMVHVVYTVIKSVLSLVGVLVAHFTGLLGNLWGAPVTSGIIANINTVFNLAPAVLIFPALGLVEKIVYKLVEDKDIPVGKYGEKLFSLSPMFFSTPALALRSLYDVLLTMFSLASHNISASFELLDNYDEQKLNEIIENEAEINMMADATGSYLVELSPHLSAELHIAILNQYFRVQTEFEHLGNYGHDLALRISQMKQNNVELPATAYKELHVMEELLNELMEYTEMTFKKRDLDSAKLIEPLKEVGVELIEIMRSNLLVRLTNNECTSAAGVVFSNVLSIIEQILTSCSNVGLATVTRIDPSLETKVHDYLMSLHSGKDDFYNQHYSQNSFIYMSKMSETAIDDREA